MIDKVTEGGSQVGEEIKRASENILRLSRSQGQGKGGQSENKEQGVRNRERQRLCSERGVERETDLGREASLRNGNRRNMNKERVV